MGGDSRRESPSDSSRAAIDVLYVDADRESARSVAETLGGSDEFAVETRAAPDTALGFLETHRVDVVVSADPAVGLDFRRAVRRVDPTVPFVLVSESDSERLLRDALSVGVDGYLAKREGYDALAAQLQDVVSAHRTAQAALSSRLVFDALSQALYEDSPFLGCVVAPDGAVQHLPRAMARTTGVDVAQSLGEPLWTLPWWPTGEQRPDIEGYVEQAATGDAVQFQSPLACADEEPRTVLWTLLPVQSVTSVDAVLLVGVDASSLVRHGRLLERQNRRLEEFSSIVSHDLRSPLSVAGGHLALARRECDSDHLGHAEMALSRMERLIEDLRAMARQGRSVGDLHDVSLSVVAKNAWASVDTGDARLVVDGDLTARCDETRLWQLFENLFRNSVEHGSTAAEGERADDPLTVRVGPLEGGTGFFVEDTGVGIPPDERETVFEMGYSSTRRGTGFGLAIVEEIVSAHRWNISVAASSEGGARFEISGVETADPD